MQGGVDRPTVGAECITGLRTAGTAQKTLSLQLRQQTIQYADAERRQSECDCCNNALHSFSISWPLSSWCHWKVSVKFLSWSELGVISSEKWLLTGGLLVRVLPEEPFYEVNMRLRRMLGPLAF